jgi:hypothetical protein
MCALAQDFLQEQDFPGEQFAPVEFEFAPQKMEHGDGNWWIQNFRGNVRTVMESDLQLQILAISGFKLWLITK